MNDLERVDHIISVGIELEELIHTHGISREDILENRTTQWLVSTPLILIGEDTNRISHELVERYPAIPWEQVAGLRHRFVHDYIGIDWERIATIVFDDLHDYLDSLQGILDDMNGRI